MAVARQVLMSSAYDFFVRRMVRELLSGLCLCRGDAKVGPDWSSPHTKRMGDYCRGLTAHSTLRLTSLF